MKPGCLLCSACFLLLLACPASAERFDQKILVDPLRAESALSKPLRDLAACEPPAQQESALKLTDVLVIALCNNPDTRQSLLAIATAAAGIGQARSQYLPQVSASASGSQSHTFADGGGSVGKSTSSGISASYLVYDFGQREIAVEQSKLAALIAEQRHSATLQAVVNAALKGYYQLLSATNALNASREAEKLAAETLDAARLRHELGLVARIDVVQAEGGFSQAEFARQQAEANVVTNKAALAVQLAWEPDREFGIQEESVPSVNDEKLAADVRKLIDFAQQRRPEIATREKELQSSKLRLETAQLGSLPSISASTSQGYSDIDIFNNRTSRSQSVGVSLSIPIFTGFSKHYSNRSAELAVEQQELSLAQEQRSVGLDVVRSYQAWMTAMKSVASSESQLSSATEAQQLSLGRYKEGVGNLLDLLSANNQLASSKQRNIETRYSVYTARADLLKSIGVLDIHSAGDGLTIVSQLFEP